MKLPSAAVESGKNYFAWPSLHSDSAGTAAFTWKISCAASGPVLTRHGVHKQSQSFLQVGSCCYSLDLTPEVSPRSLHTSGVRLGHTAFLGMQGQSQPKPGKPHLRPLPSLLLGTGACWWAPDSGDGLRGEEATGHHPPDFQYQLLLESSFWHDWTPHFWILNVLDEHNTLWSGLEMS